MRNFSKAVLVGFGFSTLAACSMITPGHDDEKATDTHYKGHGAHAYKGEHDYFKSDQPRQLKGTDFDRYLNEGYRALAKKEDQEHDFDDLEKFQSRALRAGDGQLVSPEELSARNLPPYTVDELRAARTRLEDAFYAGASVRMPKESATAQVMFDCWMEQQEENIQQHDIDECKRGFMAAMALLENKPAVPHKGPSYTHSHDHEHHHGPGSCVDHTHDNMPVVESCPAPKAEVTPAARYAGPYIIFFDLDRANITREAQRVLDNVVADAREMKPKRVVLVGHTDTSGNRAHNADLSKRRAESTSRVLQSEGIRVSEIRASHQGESQLRVNTPDGVRKAGNRRVEIHFEW